MAVNQTNVTIVGRLVSEPELKRTMNDVDVTHFRMASNERRYDKGAQQWVKGDTLFVDVTCWRRLAFNVRACLAKGDPVIVTGRLYTEEYELDGKRRSNIKMEAASVGPDLGWITAVMPRRKDKADGGPGQPAEAEPAGAAADSTEDPRPPALEPTEVLVSVA